MLHVQQHQLGHMANARCNTTRMHAYLMPALAAQLAQQWARYLMDTYSGDIAVHSSGSTHSAHRQLHAGKRPNKYTQHSWQEIRLLAAFNVAS